MLEANDVLTKTIHRRARDWLPAMKNGSAPQAEPSIPRNAPKVRDWGASLFVWGTWSLMLIAALTVVGRYSRNVPFMDDWEMVPVLTGLQLNNVAWLWEQHSDHRIPLAKLVLVAIYK